MAKHKRGKHRHLTPSEICNMMNTEYAMTKRSDESVYAGLATVFNYILWKKEKFSTNKLIDFNERFDFKYAECDGEYQYLQDLLWEKAEWTIEMIEEEKRENATKWIHRFSNHEKDLNNYINYKSTCYLLVAFGVLMDLGYGKKRLERVKDEVNKLIETAWGYGEIPFDVLHKELLDGTGIYVKV